MAKYHSSTRPPQQKQKKLEEAEDAASKLENIPSSYQEIFNYYGQFQRSRLFSLRKETMVRIERITGRPLITYVSKTYNLQPDVPSYIDDSDLTGFNDLVNSVEGDKIDIFIISNGGKVESAERIVKLVRGKFSNVRYIVSDNAFSAATLICLSGNEILMTAKGTLGPIDPQIRGIPARAIIRGFETVQKKLETEGPRGLPAYIPLLEKYDLPTLELCHSAQELSEECARSWVSKYMLECPPDDPTVDRIVSFLSSYDNHKSHGRSINLEMTKDIGLHVTNLEECPDLERLVTGLSNQYEFSFDKTPFYKYFENIYGINWGRQAGEIQIINRKK